MDPVHRRPARDDLILAALIVVALLVAAERGRDILDGILVGAGDPALPGLGGLWTMLIFLPCAALVPLFAVPGSVTGLVLLCVGLRSVDRGTRSVPGRVRASGTAWLVTGAEIAAVTGDQAPARRAPYPGRTACAGSTAGRGPARGGSAQQKPRCTSTGAWQRLGSRNETPTTSIGRESPSGWSRISTV